MVINWKQITVATVGGLFVATPLFADVILVPDKFPTTLIFNDGDQIIQRNCQEKITDVNSQNDCTAFKLSYDSETNELIFHKKIITALKLIKDSHDVNLNQMASILRKYESTVRDLIVKKENLLQEKAHRRSQVYKSIGNINSAMKKLENEIRTVGKADSLAEGILEKIKSSELNRVNHLEQMVLKKLINTPGLSTSFVPISAGTFNMGNSKSSNLIDKPFEITLIQDFEMQTAEVTQLEYFMLTGKNPSYLLEKYCPSEYVVIDGIEMCPSHPVSNITWLEANDFVEKFNYYTIDKYTYDLPTEWQWEYAAKNEKDKFNFSVSVSDSHLIKKGIDHLSLYSWFKENSDQRTHRVKSKLPDGKGLYDMLGNVSELMKNEMGDYPDEAVAGLEEFSNKYTYQHYSYRSRNARNTEQTFRSVRGGNYYNTFPYYLSYSTRYYVQPDQAELGLGIRLVRVKKEDNE